MARYDEINFEAWSRSMIGFIRDRGLEREFTDWCGGWRSPVESGNPAEMRDWLAAHAPVNLFDAAMACGWHGLEPANMADDSSRAVLWAVMALMRYEYADAMLVERAKGDRA